VVQMARASMFAKDLRSCVTPRSVGRSKASNLLFGVLTKRPKYPGLRKVVTLRGEAVERRSWSRSQHSNARLQPLRALGADDIGCSESQEEGNTRTPSSEHRCGSRVLRSGITGPCCSPLQGGELPSSPSKPDHRPCSRHRKVRHVAREGRCGEERQTAWLFSSSRSQGLGKSSGGQGRQPRTEEDRRLAGVPACRNRVAEIGSRNRGSEKRIVGPLRRSRG
jgi:hypothetical protein